MSKIDMKVQPEGKWSFRTRSIPTNENVTTKAYAMWTKCRKSILLAFPTAHQTEFYRKLFYMVPIVYG